MRSASVVLGKRRLALATRNHDVALFVKREVPLVRGKPFDHTTLQGVALFQVGYLPRRGEGGRHDWRIRD